MIALTADNLQQVKEEAQAELEGLPFAAAQGELLLEDWRIKSLGRKGVVPQLLRQLKDLSTDDKKVLGPLANQLRGELEEKYEERATETHLTPPLSGRETKSTHPDKGEREGVTRGHLHPISMTFRRLKEIFAALGFLIVEGPEVDLARYNFDDLNIPFDHPARTETDTFYLANFPELVLRTHVSTLQVRAVADHDLTPPWKFMYSGRCFRNEKLDATHEATFNQFEFMVVDEQVSIADIKAIAQTVYSTFFGKEVDIRFRPAYFPFVEPGFEIDISCVFCESGCRICKHTGWIEMAGAGSVHPNVLKSVNVNPEKYQGIAMGAAVDRLAMLWHGIDDIRHFWSGDIRFLRQFHNS